MNFSGTEGKAEKTGTVISLTAVRGIMKNMVPKVWISASAPAYLGAGNPVQNHEVLMNYSDRIHASENDQTFRT
jgi:hypothetical protein